MKKVILIAALFMSSLSMFAQVDEKTTMVGVSLQPLTISEAFSFGLGAMINGDLQEGEGFGYVGEVYYLLVDDTFSDFFDSGLQAQASAKYDFIVGEGFQLAPQAGLGYLRISGTEPFSGQDFSDSDIYFLFGGMATYQISNGLTVGLNLAVPTLSGADLTLGAQLLFHI